MAYSPLRHLGLKCLSVGLAVLLWATVAREQVVERGLTVPLEFHNVPDGLEIVNDPPPMVDVRIRGGSGTLGRIGQGDVVAVLDLRSARPGRRLFHLLSDTVRRPFGIEVAQIIPTSVAIELEPLGTRVVRVVPEVEGEPAPGYRVGAIVARPATVEVTGPESRLRDLTHATTEPVSVEGATETVRERVTVGVAGRSVRVSQERTAEITVEIVPLPVSRAPGVTPDAGR